MTAEESVTLSTFYKQWKEYQDKLKASVAPLTAEQLALRAAPDLRSIGENATHIIGCRAGWFTYVLGEDGGENVKSTTTWDEPGAAPRTGAELAQALDWTWDFMASCISRWSDDDMRVTFEDDWDGVKVQLSRAWIVWHVLEHDLHHGGEISLTLGMHSIPAEFTS
ncbi:MAG TPA: DinB family protein [Ktedonobacterales bacterium]